MKVFEIMKVTKAYYVLFKIEQSEKKISLPKLYFKKKIVTWYIIQIAWYKYNVT